MKRSGAMMAMAATLLAAAVPVAAQDNGVLWTAAPKSMSEYITEGWQISSHTYQQYSNGNDYNFILQKDNKAVICFVWLPERKDMVAHCRLLN
ncbi:hypothetical protein GRI97_02750 [Altererythrobacter xixiisoli]|uniref:Uncharacterized protein n=1 Tax=Croceibacterium xixiisoli TaxID=1476466 RepID=A0A6I4TSL3_9SPHN|nr:hypothetical protein [Croceibacterium xixiisoli]MXO97907.1 hypothetical protein [Croceibacterium xixiisoli]